LQRHDIWEYPLDALREAIINALIHRDYTAVGDVQIRVEEDRIHIWNPGALPVGVTLTDLLRDPPGSFPRNPLLARTFFFAGLVESWGTGTTRMRQLCRGQGLPEPDFREEAGGFAVVFSKDAFSPDRLRSLGLDDDQLRVVQAAKEAGRTTSRGVQVLLGVSRATATRLLDVLVTKGVFARRGKTGRAAHYVLNASETPQTPQ
jgi:ATP-dependent DNA helicase RecG